MKHPQTCLQQAGLRIIKKEITMLKKVHLEPENKTFAEVMSNGKSYVVPAFQRDYTWEEEQLDELWQDIQHIQAHKTQHFMGYLVLQSADNRSFQIIDGQQRITTVTLIIVAVLARFNELIAQGIEAGDNEKRREETHKRYLGVFDVVTLGTAPKLALNRNNKDHFREIVDLPYGIPRARGIIATNRKLNKAFEFFYNNLPSCSGKALAELIEVLGDGLLFTAITVRDDLDAFLVFETLNARGIHLSAPDLLKNYLLSTLRPGEKSHAVADFEGMWSRTLEQLGETNFTAFLRSYEGMFSRLRHKKELYRYLKERISSAEQVMPYIKALKENSSVYAALQNPDDAFWKEYDSGKYGDCIEDLRVLRLFNIKTPLSLLMAAYRQYDAGDFNKLVRWLAVIAVRYNVICQKSAKEQERLYNGMANALMRAAGLSRAELKKQLTRSVYPPDNEFVSAFSVKTLPARQGSQKIIYLLSAIAGHTDAGKLPMDRLSVEHVLPYNPTAEWQEYFGMDTYNEAIDRLANFALLPAPKNRAMDRVSFAKKKVILKNSGLKINRQIAAYEDWNMDSINRQQKWLANQAKTVWKMN